MHLFTPHHIKLLEDCYPSKSVAAADHSPKPQETSRLVYYASNRPEKLQKIGRELEARALREITKARSGSVSSSSSANRNSLLVTLALLRTLATECREEISVLTPHLLKAVETVLEAFPADLEVLARAAGVLTIWCAHINGVPISAEEENMSHLLNSLASCAALCQSKLTGNDDEMRNRKSLIGYAALFAAVDCPELFRTRSHSQPLLQLVIPTILQVISATRVDRLQSRLQSIEEDPQPMSYMSDFRPVALAEKRSPSIYVHVDGTKGPTETDILDACLRIFCLTIQKANAVSLLQAFTCIVDYLADAKLWDNADLCSWVAIRALNWAPYQHRYLIHTKILDRLLAVFPDGGDQPHSTLLRMLHSILSSSIAVANIATSDVLKQLLALLLRLVSSGCSDQVTDWAVMCISDLARHIYYADQIQDLVQEVILKITTLRPSETVDVASGSGHRVTESVRVRYLCLCLRVLGYFVKAVGQHGKERFPNSRSISRQISESVKSIMAVQSSESVDRHSPEENGKPSHGAFISPEIWQPTLGFLVDESLTLRQAYCRQLVAYLQSVHETDLFGSEIIRPPPTSPLVNDVMTRFLHALHANIFMAVTGSSGEVHPDSGPSGTEVEELARPKGEVVEGNGAKSNGHSGSIPPQEGEIQDDTKTHYIILSQVLATLYGQKRIKTLFTGVPMLIALEKTMGSLNLPSEGVRSRKLTIELLTYTWRTIAVLWECPTEVTVQLNQVISRPLTLPDPRPEDSLTVDSYSAPNRYGAAELFSPCIVALAANRRMQEATGLNSDHILQRLGSEWTYKGALEASSDQFSFQGSGSNIAPLSFIKLSPQLMQVENLSLSSVARSVRAIGAGDLREALHGSNSNESGLSGNRTRFEPSIHQHLQKRDPGLPNIDANARRRPSVSRLGVSPNAVQEIFASIGLQDEPVPNKKLKPRFHANASSKLKEAATADVSS